MYTPGRIYRPVFQPPCGGNGFRNAADTARPVLITIHTYCPHILPIPAPCRLLPTILQHMESINFYGYPSTVALPPPPPPLPLPPPPPPPSLPTSFRTTHLTTDCLFLYPSPETATPIIFFSFFIVSYHSSSSRSSPQRFFHFPSPLPCLLSLITNGESRLRGVPAWRIDVRTVGDTTASSAGVQTRIS